MSAVINPIFFCLFNVIVMMRDDVFMEGYMQKSFFSNCIGCLFLNEGVGGLVGFFLNFLIYSWVWVRIISAYVVSYRRRGYITYKITSWAVT